MSQERIELGENPRLTLECQGDLKIVGWSETAVLLKGADYETQETEDGLLIQSQGDLRLTAPGHAALTVRQAQGDLSIKQVSGPVNAADIFGDAMLVGLGQVKLQTVHGDLSAKQLAEPLNVETVYGDLSCRQIFGANVAIVHGDFTARYVSGDMRLGTVNGDVNLAYSSGGLSLEQGRRDVNVRQVEGLLQLKQVSGDIRLRGGLGEGEHYCQANGDIVVRWPADTPLNLDATAPTILNRLALEGLEEKEGRLVGSLGAGKTHLTLIANGRIILKESRQGQVEWEGGDEDFSFGFSLDFENLGERIGREVEAQMSRLSAEFQNQFGPEFAQKMAEKMTRQAEKAAARAERAAERAQQQAEKQTRWQSNWGAPPPPPPPPRPAKPGKPTKATKPPEPKATPEEQLKILKMVEQGVISPEEANTLLEAIEG
jgi:hypothetical protein